MAHVCLKVLENLSANYSEKIFTVPSNLKPKSSKWLSFAACVQDASTGIMRSEKVYIAEGSGAFYARGVDAISSSNNLAIVGTLTWEI